MNQRFALIGRGDVRFVSLLVVLCACVVLFFGAATQLAHAQSNSAGVGLRPANIDPNREIDPGEVLQETLTITNRSEEDQIYYLFTRDIIGVQGGGVPIFAEDDIEQTGYELSNWVRLDRTQVAIPAGSQETVDIEIEVPDNATPGSHFGGVFVSIQPPELRESGAAVGYRVANIIHIRVSGEALEQASIRQFSTDQFIYGSPEVEFEVRIENSGNVLVRPTGPLEIYNMFGQQVDLITFNDNRSGVFPSETRSLTETWKYDGVGFGRYEAVVSASYGYEGSMRTISSTVTFWVLPMNIIGPAAITLLVLLLVTYIAIKLYIRRTVAALSGRRIGRRRRKGETSATLAIVISLLTVTALFLIVLLLLFA